MSSLQEIVNTNTSMIQEKYKPIFDPVNLAANATTVVASAIVGTVGGSTGTHIILHSITINTKGATSNTCTVYDNTAGSGTKIATIDTTQNVGTLIFDCKCSTGLTIVLAVGTSADITVNYSIRS